MLRRIAYGLAGSMRAIHKTLAGIICPGADIAIAEICPGAIEILLRIRPGIIAGGEAEQGGKNQSQAGYASHRMIPQGKTAEQIPRRLQAGPALMFGLVFQPAGGILDLAPGLVHFALGLQLGIAQNLAGDILHAALGLLQRTFNPVFIHTVSPSKIWQKRQPRDIAFLLPGFNAHRPKWPICKQHLMTMLQGGRKNNTQVIVFACYCQKPGGRPE